MLKLTLRVILDSKKIVKPLLWMGFFLLILAPRALWAQSGLEFQNPSVLIPVDLTGIFNRYNIVIPDLLPLVPQGPNREEASRFAKRLGANLDMTGYFRLLDPRASLELKPRAGLTGEEPLDYSPWAKIGANFVIKGAIEVSGSSVVLEFHLFDISTGRKTLGKRYSGNLKDARQMINRFTNEVLLAITGEPGVFGSKIIFVSGETIMVTELGSDEAQKLYSGKGVGSSHPTLGPGNRTAWTRLNGKKWELVVDGKVIYSGNLVVAPTFSPDGQILAGYSGLTSTNIAEFTGKAPRVITSGGGIEISPSFSPDGGMFAYVSDQAGSAGIYVAPASGGPGTRLSPPGKSTDPDWSPKGDKIVFVVGERDIAIINVDGSGFVQLTGGQGLNRHPTFSPDGRMIVFSSTRGGKSQLYVMAANGDRQQPLIPEYTLDQTLPSWSPEMPEM
ncbi:MAG: hypothetical protein LBF22_13310 [Deltaproteobacteria bacterium]|jgi:TolB protein|nr:hypothetical protein [Deltaproteobacteria bacterium]